MQCFFASQRHLARGIDPQSHSIPDDFQHHNSDRISDHECFQRIAAQDKHWFPFILGMAHTGRICKFRSILKMTSVESSSEIAFSGSRES